MSPAPCWNRKMQIFVKARRALVLDVDDGTLVEAVQEQVASRDGTLRAEGSDTALLRVAYQNNASTGVHVQAVRLAFGGARLRPTETLASRGIRAGSTLISSGWVPGGAGKQVSITVKPRVQKDKWSLYWKVRFYILLDTQRGVVYFKPKAKAQESMETKTELLEDVKMELKSGLTVAEVHQSVQKRFGWVDSSTLQRCKL